MNKIKRNIIFSIFSLFSLLSLTFLNSKSSTSLTTTRGESLPNETYRVWVDVKIDENSWWNNDDAQTHIFYGNWSSDYSNYDGEKFTIYFKDTFNWGSVNLYQWGTATSLGGWPGAQMISLDDNWYSCDIPLQPGSGSINLIFFNPLQQSEEGDIPNQNRCELEIHSNTYMYVFKESLNNKLAKTYKTMTEANLDYSYNKYPDDDGWKGQDANYHNLKPLIKDNNNDYYYFDIPKGVIDFTFFREAGTPKKVWNKTEDFSYSLGQDNIFYQIETISDIADPNVTFTVNTPLLTDVVETFISSTEDVCLPVLLSERQTLIENVFTSYNTLTTFEKAQYNNMHVGDGIFGHQRLEYLNSYLLAITPEQNLYSHIPETNNNKPYLIATFILMGSITLVSAFFVLRKHKSE